MRFLVVDDSRAIRAYVQGTLKSSLDCEIDGASSGFEALRLLPRNVYDVIITDINMPDINGLELIRFIRKSENHRFVPIIIISTQSSGADRQRAMDLGATNFLSKPFKPVQLVDLIAELTRSDEVSL